jgi:alpha-L-arabinofuranosidase
MGVAGLTLSRFSVGQSAAQSRTVNAHIEVLVNEPRGTISPNIYGHVTEDLGGVIYDGIWVLENSKIANVHGIRKSLPSIICARFTRR